MEQKYYSVKLTISQLTEGQCRSRIEAQSPDGANFGDGNDFKFDLKAKSENVPSVEEFVQQLTQGGLGRQDTIRFGKWLFESVFQRNVSTKYAALEATARAKGRTLRLCLALHSAELINVPWEFLHDGNDFLIKRGYPIVRILDELAGAKSSFAPIRRILIAAANPVSDRFDRFDAEEHISKVKSLLEKSGIETRPLEHASRDELLKVIGEEALDAVYFVGHGVAWPWGGSLICEGPNKKEEELDSSTLAQALREAGKVRFVYLNSCSTAKASSGNPFQGVAQKLMLDGNVAAVAAMQVDVRQRAALSIAENFFTRLTHQGSESAMSTENTPEDAMQKARTSAATDPYSFGIPVLYSYLDAPDQYEQNTLETFLAATPQSRYALVLGSFYLGQPAEDGQPEIPQDGKYRYPGETFAREDTQAALNVIKMLSIIAPPEKIDIFPIGPALPTDYTHFFLFGSRSNRYVKAIQREYSDKFEFEYKENERWRIRDLEYGHEYAVDAPNKLSLSSYRDSLDWGVIQKIHDDDGCVYFLIAGLGSRATEGCGWHLSRHWRSYAAQEDFATVLMFPAGLDFARSRVIDRKTGHPKGKP